MLKVTTAQRKIARLRKRVRVVRGGTSSSKTFSIIPILIDYACKNPGVEISIVSESFPHLKKGAIKDFRKIMEWTGLWSRPQWNKTDSVYTFANEAKIEFFSADQSGKVHGPRRDVLFVNECNRIHFDIYLQLAMRTSRFIYLDYNPVNEFWVDEEILGEEDAEMVVLTYKDNEACPPEIVKMLERGREKAKTSEYWKNWWDVYGLGKIGSLEGVVFSNWKTIDSIPGDARLVGMGLDFGYSNDVTAVVEIYKWNDKRIVNEILYETGLTNQDIARRIKKGSVIYADSAEPKSIREIQLEGHRIKAVEKGRDSIQFGIQTMQEQEYLVTSGSTNLIKELRSYCWEKDKAGMKTNIPAGVDHAIDAWRYHEMMSLGVDRSLGKYSIS